MRKLRIITLPDPIAFGRERYADILGEHERLLVEHADRLHAETTALLRDERDYELADCYVAVIRGPRPDDVEVLHRETAVEVWRCYRGVAERLIDKPPLYTLQVIVTAGGVVSLHAMKLEARRLAVVDRALVVEPRVQRHRVSGLGPLLVTRWVDPGGEARYAWVRIPPEPATPAEALDRMLSRREAEARTQIAAFLRSGGKAAYAWILSTALHDSITVLSIEAAPPTLTLFPAIAEGIERGKGRGRVPVVVTMEGHARLRWIDLATPTPTPAEQDEIVEESRWPLEGEAVDAEPQKGEGAEESVGWLDFPKRERNPDAVDVMHLLKVDGCFSVIDTDLGRMNDEELDRAIAAAGFDPALERGGVGLREEVVDAIDNVRLGDGDE